MSVNRDQQADGVDAISNTSKGKSDLDTQLVDDSSSKEAKNSEGTVESNVLDRM